MGRCQRLRRRTPLPRRQPPGAGPWGTCQGGPHPTSQILLGQRVFQIQALRRACPTVPAAEATSDPQRAVGGRSLHGDPRPPPPRGPATCCRLQGPEGGGEGRARRAMPGRRGVGVTCGRQVPSTEKQERVAAARGCVKEGGGARSPQGRAQIGCPERGTREAAEGNEFAFLKGRNLPFTPRV